VITDDIDTIVPSFMIPTIGPFGSPWMFNVPVCLTVQGSAHAIPLVASRPANTLTKPRIFIAFRVEPFKESPAEAGSNMHVGGTPRSLNVEPGVRFDGP
jgi:hypothetical protein